MTRDRNLTTTVLGVAYFWFFATLVLLATWPTPAAPFLVAGIVAGTLVAPQMLGAHIEMGLVPVGGFGMGLSCLLAYALSASTGWMAAAVALAGFAAGWFNTPLHALVYRLPDPADRGRMLTVTVLTSTVFITLAWAVHDALSRRAGFDSAQIIGLAGGLTLLVTAYTIAILPTFFVRFVIWMITHSLYRIHVVGAHHVPARGPALIIANHISMVDPPLVGASLHRFVRFLMWGPHFQLPVLNWFARQLHAIPVTAGNRREVTDAIDRSRAALLEGHVVCIFVEGAVSRTGNLLPFKRGFEKILADLDIPIVPAYLDRVWGSVFSFKGGRFFWKIPSILPYPVTVAFGPPLPASTNALDARLALMELGAEAVRHRRKPHDLLHTIFLRTAKRRWFRRAMADSSGQKLSYGRALVRSMQLSRVLRRRTEGQNTIGIMLPASVDGALANIAVLMAGRVPVNLNFTAAADMRLAIQDASVRTIISSRRFLETAGLPAPTGTVFLEDLRSEITTGAKVAAFSTALLVPWRLLRRRYGGDATSSSTATIIFSGGRTGTPKGVVLSHANILANVDAIDQIFPVQTSDCFIGVLPFFHSLGLTGTLWFPLLQGCSVAYHPNPMDAKAAGELAGEHRASVLISTPTFFAATVTHCTPAQFAKLKYAIAGEEKLPQSVAAAFQDRFGVALLEGYGCAEMAPVVAVNRPNFGQGRTLQVGSKFGSVGHPMPGVAAKVVDADTFEGPVFGRPGLLLVKGPNLMTGYLNQPERTAEVMRDGWYVTGDTATMDEDGFIFVG